MPSPFPGMDPYLENSVLWPEVHGRLIWRIDEYLNSVLPDRYTAHVDRYVWLEEASGDERVRDGVPDVYVADRESPSSGGLATLTFPSTVQLPTVRREGNRFVRIVDRDRRRVVTVLEILSPSNKDPGADRDAYLLKRSEYFTTRTNLVEFDLLRAGHRMPLGQPEHPVGDYLILVCPPATYPSAGSFAFGVRDPFPVIPVPLDAAEPPVMLDLKPIIDRTYDAGRYRREIDYTQPPVPPLTEPDATWARTLLAAHAQGGS